MSSTKQTAFQSQDESLFFEKNKSKSSIAISVLVVIVSVVVIVGFVYFSLSTARNSRCSEDFELKLVHLIFRHGDRTPTAPTYPFDPHINETYEPYGHGQLTKAGFLRSYLLGKSFNQRYGNFLGHSYEQNKVYALSTDYTRTKMSLQLVAAGMFAQNSELDLNWRPFDFVVEVPDNNSLLYPLQWPCERFWREYTANFAPVVEKHKKVFDLLESHTGKPFVGLFDVIKLYSDLKAQKDYGLKLPVWASDFYPEPLSTLSNEAWGFLVHSEVWKRIHGGAMLKRLIDDWESSISGASNEKLMLWSGHDATVVGVLGALNLWNSNDTPDYGITAIFELKQNRKTDEFGVEIYLKKGIEDEPLLLTIPGCTSICPLSKLKVLLESRLPRAGDCD